MTAILGLSAFYHDSAAALVVDGRIVAAAQEERFTRIKHDPAFPVEGCRLLPARGGPVGGRPRLRRLLRQAADEVRAAAGNLPRLCPCWASSSFRQAIPLWLKDKLHHAAEIRRALGAETRPSWSSPTITRATRPARSFPARSTRRRFSRWTAWASGARPRSGPAGQPDRSDARNPRFRTRWGCFIPHSPIIAASRSTAANTS